MKIIKLIISLLIITTLFMTTLSYSTNTIAQNTSDSTKYEVLIKQLELAKQNQLDMMGLDGRYIKIIEAKILSLPNSNYLKKSNILRLSSAIYYYAKINNIEVDLLISIGYIESKFNKYVISLEGCIGYFQINPHVHKTPTGEARYDEFYQTKKAVEIYKDFLKHFDGNISLALNGYNAGYKFSKNHPYAKKVLKLQEQLKSRGNNDFIIIG